MAWPTATVDTTNVDSGTDNPRLARVEIDDCFDKLNLIIEGPALYNTRSDLSSATVPTNVPTVWTAGYSTNNDGGGAQWDRVVAEPSHAFKVSSNGGTVWWEGVPQGGKVYAEQFGAAGDGVTDDQSALTDALAYVNSTGTTLVARKLYALASTLVFPAGQYGFEGPDQTNLSTLDAGFKWTGGNNDTVIEINRIHQCTIGPILVSNTATQATGMTAVEIIAPSSGTAGDSIGQNVFQRFYLTGFNKGLQIGNFTRDGWNTNFDDNVIQDLQTYHVANPLILDGGNMDNNLILRFHNGGPTSLSAYVGTRSHIIWAKSNGIGFKVLDGFTRVDGITSDNAAVRIDKGSFSCDHFSFETSGSDNCRLVDLNSTAIGRTQCVLKQVVATNIRDTSDKAMSLNYKSGTLLEGCSVAGDIEILGPAQAVNTVFETGYEFTGSELRRLSQHHTYTRSSPNAAVTNDDDIRAPSSLSASQNDYSVKWAHFIRQAASSSVNITGFDSLVMARSGQGFMLLNANSAGSGVTITLTNQDAASSSINRIQSVTNANIVLDGQEAVMLRYDILATRWIAWKL